MDHGSTANALSAPTERRRLVERSFVSLAEALTWIAFGDAMTPDELRAQVEGQLQPNLDSPEVRLRTFFSGADDDVPEVPGAGHFHCRQSGLKRLGEALEILREHVERETIKVRGRYTSTYSLSDAHIADVAGLTGGMLTTFSQFDVSTGGLRRQPEGAPSVVWSHHDASFQRELVSFIGDDRARDGYLLVEVERDGLVRKASTAGTSRASSVKAGRPPSDERILAKADEMKACGKDGRTIAGVMRHEPGFENVATTHVRSLIKGRWKPGGRPPRNGA